MKIGILTLPLHNNYGGILQAYALQTVLESMGHEVIFLNGKYKELKFPLWKVPLILSKRVFQKYILQRKNIVIFLEKERYKKDIQININTERFINEIFTLPEHSLTKLPANYVETIIVGSDQIWRSSYNKNIYDAFLEFALNWNIKRIAYAPSFGKDTLGYTQLEITKCSKLLKKFDAVSVREISGIGLCKDNFNINAEIVLDPTMLLDPENYIKLIDKCNLPKNKGDFMVYILDEAEDKLDVIEYLSKKYNLTVFKTGAKPGNETLPISERIQPPLEEWIKGFYDAKFVFTDSFHGCVFSILFNKPFIAYGNVDRGIDRFTSLLTCFDLQDRLILNSTEVKEIEFNGINWESVNKRLDELRFKSSEFLRKSLTK